MSSLNWADLIKDAGEATTYEALPDGDYDFTIKEATYKVSQSGKPMFSVKAQVENGAHANRLVWDNLVVSAENPTALGMFFKKMAALGLSKEYFDSSPSNAQIEQSLVGRRFRGQVGSRMYNGERRNELKNYYPAVGASVVAAPAGAVSQVPAPAPAPAPAPSGAPSAPF